MTRPGDPIDTRVTFRGRRSRPSEAVPAAPSGPRTVTVLPTPEWPVPAKPAAPDAFREARLRHARERHARAWYERHPGDVVGRGGFATKLCGGCRRMLPLTEYHRDASREDGLTKWCRDCRRRPRGRTA